MAASNRAGAASEEVTVRPVTFGSAASFITSGMEAAGGLWVGQRVKPFHRPSSQTPVLALVKTVAQGRPAATRGDCPAPVTPTTTPPLKITTFQGSERRNCRPGADLGCFEPHEADCAEPRPRVIGL